MGNNFVFDDLALSWPESTFLACLPGGLSGSGDCGNKTSQPNWRLWSELQKGGILVSRILDIFFQESGHFMVKTTSQLPYSTGKNLTFLKVNEILRTKKLFHLQLLLKISENTGLLFS